MESPDQTVRYEVSAHLGGDAPASSEGLDDAEIERRQTSGEVSDCDGIRPPANCIARARDPDGEAGHLPGRDLRCPPRRWSHSGLRGRGNSMAAPASCCPCGNIRLRPRSARHIARPILASPDRPSLLGRVLDGLGRPVDGGPQLSTRCWHESTVIAPRAVDRPRIDRPLETGVRVLDGLLTCGRGQRIGLFAGSGVARAHCCVRSPMTARADMNVIALVVKRGREVRPFLEDCLAKPTRTALGRRPRHVEEPPLMRVRAVLTAVAIASSFRDQGNDVCSCSTA